VTEIYDYLRLLWARSASRTVPTTATPVTRQKRGADHRSVLAWPAETRIEVLAPIVRGRKGEFREPARRRAEAASSASRVDGETHDWLDVPPLNRPCAAHDRRKHLDAVSAGQARTESVICAALCRVTGVPSLGQCGMPTRAQSSRR